MVAFRETATIFAKAKTPYISSINVESKRCGVGTKLYQQAAKVACQTFKQPLHSDTSRTEASDGFWQKQVKKDRAICLQTMVPADYASHDDAVFGRSGCERYQLKCPAPRDLSGRRKR